MAAPTFVAAGTGVIITLNAGSASVGVTATAAKQLILLHAVMDGSTSIPTLSALTNLTDLAGGTSDLSNINVGDIGIGTSSEGGQWFWLGWSTATAVSLTATVPSAVDGYFRMYAFQDVFRGTAVDHVIENSGGFQNLTRQIRRTDATMEPAGVTTLGPDRLAVSCIGITDDASGLAAPTGESGGDWILATAIFESATGTDATLGLLTATMPARGAIANGSASIVSLPWGSVSFALRGTTQDQVNTQPKVVHMGTGLSSGRGM